MASARRDSDRIDDDDFEDDDFDDDDADQELPEVRAVPKVPDKSPRSPGGTRQKLLNPPLGQDERVIPSIQAVLQVLQRSTWDEVLAWGEALGLREPEEREPGREELPARIVLFILESERVEPSSLVRIPSRPEIAAAYYESPQSRPPKHSEIVARVRENIEIDGQPTPISLSNFETIYEALRTRRHGDTPLDGLNQEETVLLRNEVMFRFGLKKRPGIPIKGRAEPRILADPWKSAPPPKIDDFGELFRPGLMASFFALKGFQRPWNFDDEPWLREPTETVDVRRLVQALEKPRMVKPHQIEGTKVVSSVWRARARLRDEAVPTGMVVRFRRWREGVKGHLSEGEVANMLEPLRAEGMLPLDALVEVSELLGIRDPKDPRAKHVAARFVRDAFGRDPVGLPVRAALDDKNLQWDDIKAIEAWSQDKKVRWGLFEVMRRAKSSMDDKALFRFASAWVRFSKAVHSEAFAMTDKTFLGPNGVQAVLNAHFWRPVASHHTGKGWQSEESRGGAPRVYEVTYKFAKESFEVTEQMLEDHWSK